MMLKTVYGLPPADMERIEALEVQRESDIIENHAADEDTITVLPKKN